MMKKPLLLLTSMLFLGYGANAQFTESTLPDVNDGTTLYLMDSLVPSFEDEIGADATWDYSQYGGLEGETRYMTMLNASDGTFGSDFPNTTHALEIENLLTYYTTVTANDAVINGYVFSEPNLGDIVVNIDDPGAVLYEFPFDLGDEVSSSYTGGTEVMSMPMNLDGELTTSVDAKGTLTLAENTYTDVYRYKLVEHADIPGTLLGDMILDRVQYEYYDFATSKFPIFVYSTVSIGQENATPLVHITTVLSADEPTFNLGLSKEELSNVKIYPNPSSDVLNIQLPSENSNVNVDILDALGRTVYSANTNKAMETINVSTFNKGVYFVKIASNDNAITQKVIIK